MRHLASVFLILPTLLLSPVPARAQGGKKILVEKVIVGMQGTAEMSRYKAGAWAPVYVYLKNDGTERINTGEYVLVVETTDGEEHQTHYTETRMLPPLTPQEASPALLAYVRPGGEASEVTVYVKRPAREGRPIDDGDTIDSKKPERDSYEALPYNAQVILAAGSKLPGMKRALIVSTDKKNPPAEIQGELGQDWENLDAKGPLRFVYTDKVEQMPQRWLGYQGVDLLVLTTNRDEFIKDLIADQTGRREALAEWVRRGGQLVISAGRNQQFVKELLAKTRLIPCELTGTASTPAMSGVATFAGVQNQPMVGTPPKDKPGQKASVEFTQLVPVPGAGCDTLATEKVGDKPWPVIVQSGSGTGRVVLVAFDLDAAPFTSWNGQIQFWQRLAREFGIEPKEERDNGNQQPMGKVPQPQRGGLSNPNEPKELADLLQTSLETFEDVPVISFGWVAFFIFLYILVVGPVDYFFLKKVVKRLELTWITFPAVVLTISALAYVTAYWLKGNDLKINKVDIVDIVLDLDSKRTKEEGAPAYNTMVHGTTWLTLYSPRIQNYTVGFEPSSGWNWSPAAADGSTEASPLVDWMERPIPDYEKRNQQGLLSWNRPTYRYAKEGAGLEGVPVRVWATKSFAASWRPAVSDDQKLFEADLRPPRGEAGELEGTITSRLPVDLQDVVLFYRNNCYTLGTLSKDEPKNINDKVRKNAGGPPNQWLSTPLTTLFPKQSGASNKTQQSQAGPVCGRMKEILFHTGQTNQFRTGTGNSMLRYLDEGWRISQGHQHELIVFGRTAGKEGKAEDLANDDISPSRLWLGSLPETGKPRRELEGTIAQETYVRVYIPIMPQGK
jgi:hypothetical protein